MATELLLPFDEPAEPDNLRRDRAARAAASDPRRNVVLEASAGTGKTRVLVDRYLNLLAAGVEPANILAITFTRKAAAEMRERIAARVRQSAALSAPRESRWRQIRERLGEVSISTIDAFCLTLLREFPLEADLDPGFEVADESETLRMREAAIDSTLAVARRMAHKRQDVRLLLSLLDERGLAAALSSLLSNRLAARRAFRRLIGPASADEAAGAAGERLSALFAARAGGIERFLADAPLWHPRFALAAAELRQLCSNEPGSASCVEPGPLALLMEDLARHFLTAAGTPRSRLSPEFPAASFPTRQAYERHRDEVRRLAPDVAAVRTSFRRGLNLVAASGLRRMFYTAEAQYLRRMEEAALVDFTEMLLRALALLARMDEFSQSRYRLEARYHHLLVDEFQDTSPAQWQLVWRLVRAWSEGQGLAAESPVPPSIFVVGDRKQSIYGFRDADVTMLSRARRQIARLRPDPRVGRYITRSFRSVAPLLSFTNDFFSAIEPARERADRFRFGGRDLFPIAGAPTFDGPAVSLSVAEDVESSARIVAGEIGRLLRSGVVRDRQTGLSRDVRPGDIAILFRTRESHREFAGALDSAGIRAYVYKGLGFFDADEVMDLTALVRYLADPFSDLRAAAFLRSRFVRLSDAAIQRLAPDGIALALRSSEPPAAMDQLSEEDRRVLDALRVQLSAWLPLADRLPPAAVIDRILAESAYAWETRGPRRAQARENIKKMRSLVRRIQNRGYATLERVASRIEQLSAGDESNAVVDAVDAVNLMTIHASKGLEFPVVFLVNVTRGAGARPSPVRVASGPRLRKAPAETAVLVGEFVSEDEDDHRGREREETKRLLYVAVTRARERLYFSAVLRDGRLKAAPGSIAEVFPPSFSAVLAESRAGAEERTLEWMAPSGVAHPLRVLPLPPEPLGEEQPAAQDGRSSGEVVALLGTQDFFGALDAAPVLARLRVTDTVAEARDDATQAAALRLQGVEAGEASDARADADEAVPAEWARLAGVLVHRLFQRALPAALDEDELVSMARLEASRLDEMGEAPTEDVLRLAVRAYRSLSERPEVAELLATGSVLYEVPFSARTANGIVRGTVDCLVRTQDDSFVVMEFKTGTPEEWHERQLASYVEALRQALPGREVTGMIVYARAGRTSEAGTP